MILQQLNGEMADVIERAQGSLVRLHNMGSGSGAGTIWHPDGLILTNAHVAGGGPLQVTRPNGSNLEAKLLACDTDIDLAALVVEASDLPTIDLAPSQNPLPGQIVLALGHPWGVVGAVTTGVVIGAGPSRGESPKGGGDSIAVSLHLRPGYSGGPLMDVHGRLLGINTMMQGPDVGVAVPVHVVKDFLRETIGSRN